MAWLPPCWPSTFSGVDRCCPAPSKCFPSYIKVIAPPIVRLAITTLQESDCQYDLHSLVHTRPSPQSDALFPFSSTVCPHCNHRKPYQLVIDRAKTNSLLNSFFYRSSLEYVTSLVAGEKRQLQFQQGLETYWLKHKFLTDSNIPLWSFITSSLHTYSSSRFFSTAGDPLD